jgi:hypothetical protein
MRVSSSLFVTFEAVQWHHDSLLPGASNLNCFPGAMLYAAFNKMSEVRTRTVKDHLLSRQM